jgi:hypothetical protein
MDWISQLFVDCGDVLLQTLLGQVGRACIYLVTIGFRLGFASSIFIPVCTTSNVDGTCMVYRGLVAALEEGGTAASVSTTPPE